MTQLYLQTGVVLVFRPDVSRWCALRAAYPGDHLVTTCLAELAYGPVNVQVVRPGERLPSNMCPQCERHVEISMGGACAPVDGPVVGRTETRDLRRPTGGKRFLAAARAALSVEDQRALCAWAKEDAATEEEWSESAVPEVVINDLTSRGVMTR